MNSYYSQKLNLAFQRKRDREKGLEEAKKLLEEDPRSKERIQEYIDWAEGEIKEANEEISDALKGLKEEKPSLSEIRLGRLYNMFV